MLSEADFLRLLRSRAGASSLATNAFMADKKMPRRFHGGAFSLR
jgi:hypothetical protein